MFKFLTEPAFPKAAIGFESTAVTVLALQRSGGSYGIRQGATVDLPTSLLTPGFLQKNISSVAEMRVLIEEAVTSAGLLNQKKWSVSLPGSTARAAIITLDAGTTRSDGEEVLDWKTEQAFGIALSEMRISRQKIAPDNDGRERYFATAVKLSVLDQYETLFEGFGWNAGLILPRAVSEAAWLSSTAADSFLISSQNDGFTAILMRGGEPGVVRSVTCTESERSDEIYRLLMFYNDRFGSRDDGHTLDRILIIGDDIPVAAIREISKEALSRDVSVLSPDDIGLAFPDAAFRFADIAAPAGLASFGS